MFHSYRHHRWLTDCFFCCCRCWIVCVCQSVPTYLHCNPNSTTISLNKTLRFKACWDCWLCGVHYVAQCSFSCFVFLPWQQICVLNALRKSAQILWQINKSSEEEKNAQSKHICITDLIWCVVCTHSTNNFHMCQNKVADLESHCACIVAKFSAEMQLDGQTMSAIFAHQLTTPYRQPISVQSRKEEYR